MGDFSAEDLFEAVDRTVLARLARHGTAAPPVDAVRLAKDGFGLPIRFAEPEGTPKEYGDRPVRKQKGEVVLNPDSPEETHHAACARGIARILVPEILETLGVVPGTENRGATNSLVGVVAPRLLMPTKWFDRDARRANYDVRKLAEIYSTVPEILIAWRLLDLEEICVISVVEDGTVSARRGNRAAAGRTLTAAEQRCVAIVSETREPASARADGWSARGWPASTGAFDRIILRAVPDEL